MLPKPIWAYVEALVARYPAVREIWLFGSRTTGTHREDSDWDLLVFADEETLNALALDCAFNRAGMDVMVVFNGDRFRKPWAHGEGSLSGWEWQRRSEAMATYRATKQRGEGSAFCGVAVSVGHARRIWSKGRGFDRRGD